MRSGVLIFSNLAGPGVIILIWAKAESAALAGPGWVGRVAASLCRNTATPASYRPSSTVTTGASDLGCKHRDMPVV